MYGVIEWQYANRRRNHNAAITTRLKGAPPLLLIIFSIILRFVDATADQQLQTTDKTGREEATSERDDRFIGEIKRAGDKPAIPFSDFAVLRTPQIRHSIVVFTIGYRLFRLYVTWSSDSLASKNHREKFTSKEHNILPN